jgi:general secretion pathway protein C
MNHNLLMLARMIAFLVWGLLACSGGYWLIQLLARPIQVPSQAQPALEQRSGQTDLTRLFGAAAAVVAEAAPAAESRFKLLGVVAPKKAGASQAGEGVALISVDGVARTVRVGASVDGNLQLLFVDGRSASLGEAGVVSMTLQIAPMAAAATGALPTAQPSPVVLGSYAPPPSPQAQFQPQVESIPRPLNDPAGPPAR